MKHWATYKCYQQIYYNNYQYNYSCRFKCLCPDIPVIWIGAPYKKENNYPDNFQWKNSTEMEK